MRLAAVASNHEHPEIPQSETSLSSRGDARAQIGSIFKSGDRTYDDRRKAKAIPESEMQSSRIETAVPAMSIHLWP